MKKKIRISRCRTMILVGWVCVNDSEKRIIYQSIHPGRAGSVNQFLRYNPLVVRDTEPMLRMAWEEYKRAAWKQLYRKGWRCVRLYREVKQ